ncbi:alpha/beta hydrolase [Saccharicrinis fermentans]|uniref:Thermostable monoacylglycerol lipase n=1 Tax=Saccharicrinis fermentans DSM 9555 = JCM 21142 TaxID=869213 RepID=W7Y2I0_9BACT|nr:alpha/beta hydrolase [Saccharicrinis fermentans]GAF01743.1 thermostable monoacylglycerol lipase [Saccharicrinis fermentans DSM 9555 = JCM 21142]
MLCRLKILSSLLLLFCLGVSLSAQLLEKEGAVLQQLEERLTTRELSHEDIKPGNEAKIIWSSTYPYKKSPIAFLYLHGFGASHREGEPIMSMLSKDYQANVYMSRLKEHGLNRRDGFKYLTEENYIASAKEALEYAKLIGDKVVIVSTSTGGTHALILAATYPDVEAIILYSPFIGLPEGSKGDMITKPGGRALFKITKFGAIQRVKRPGEVGKFWSTSYHLKGYVTLMNLVRHSMCTEIFSEVTCPVFLGYYYKSEKEQDRTVGVPAMLHMYEALGTPDSLKMKMAFPETGNHVIGCDLRSRDWQTVYKETKEFIDQKIIKK